MHFLKICCIPRFQNKFVSKSLPNRPLIFNEVEYLVNHKTETIIRPTNKPEQQIRSQMLNVL